MPTGLDLLKLSAAVAGMCFDTMGGLKAFKMYVEFELIYDNAFYNLIPATEFCVAPAVLDDAAGIKNFRDDGGNDPGQYPHLICSDDRGNSNTTMQARNYNTTWSSGSLTGRLLLSATANQQNITTSDDSTTTPQPATTSPPWVNNGYHLNTRSGAPGDLTPVNSFCPTNYDCSRDRSDYGYPAEGDINIGDFAFCIHKNLTCGNKQWCAAYAELALEGDYNVHEKCEGCIPNSGSVFVAMIILTILSACCGCCGCVASCKETFTGGEDEKELPKAIGFATKGCDMCINGSVLIVVFAANTALFFTKLEEADCLGPAGAVIMKDVKITNDELAVNIAAACGLSLLVLVLNCASLMF